VPDLDWQFAALIFSARVVDVSLGTVRVMMLVAGSRWLAGAIGFVEILIWVLAVGGVVAHLHDPLVVVAYAGGFATGVVVGGWVEERLALGYRTVHVWNANSQVDVTAHLRAGGFRVTRLSGAGRSGQVEVCVSIIRRRALSRLRRAIEEVTPRAFITVERAERPARWRGPRHRAGRRWWLFGPRR
jgi:uncharacterized protein YebE (UPF0316 family)